ncbi:hypothetical protein HG536_0G00740 [Torulaspora globosa]|uniref:Chromosome segregation in meiosis protein n=1 Tax=Torulaspora globosa TaxID=48254 RepID=A0A7G3ZL31_9SACH|nr:uncharacterized protein HG536_0G00740 [Torulaspora globosa]QLL34217.1 hypothetical protein HG536_0G00740 [Torulaspora globosa]
MGGELWFGIDAENETPIETEKGSTNSETLVDPTLVDPTAVVGSLRRRTPQIKLTAERLVGERGLPYVMKHAPKAIRISKKRNAHDNLSHIIQFYQLWAHDLFPKARFGDFIRLCHSLGKSDKMLREYRKNLYRHEMHGEESMQPSDVRAGNAEDLEEDDIYTAASQQPAEAPERSVDEPPASTEQDQNLDTQEMFVEDEDAMEAMRELGF